MCTQIVPARGLVQALYQALYQGGGRGMLGTPKLGRLQRSRERRPARRQRRGRAPRRGAEHEGGKRPLSNDRDTEAKSPNTGPRTKCTTGYCMQNTQSAVKCGSGGEDLEYPPRTLPIARARLEQCTIRAQHEKWYGHKQRRRNRMCMNGVYECECSRLRPLVGNSRPSR